MRLTTLTWLEAGLPILAEAGPEALTIEALCQRLGVTKGSFYHHFKNRQDYQQELLRHWEAGSTEHLITLSSQGVTPAERLRTLTEHSLALPPSLEIAIRAWALHDPIARSAQERVDALRLRYLEEQYRALIPDPARAVVLAKLAYTCFIGSQQLVPSLQGEDLKPLMGELWRLVHPTPAQEENHGDDA